MDQNPLGQMQGMLSKEGRKPINSIFQRKVHKVACREDKGIGIEKNVWPEVYEMQKFKMVYVELNVNKI